MKKLLSIAVLVVAIVVAIAVWPHSTLPPPLKVGQEMQVGEEALPRLVQMKNLRPIGDINFFNTSCEPFSQGSITARALDGSRTLVTYRTAERISGGDCPNGALFFLNNSDIRSVKSDQRDRFLANRQERHQLAKEKAQVRQLLGQ